MDEREKELDEFEKKVTAVETGQKLRVGVKVLLTVIILGAIAAGVYIALALGR